MSIDLNQGFRLSPQQRHLWRVQQGAHSTPFNASCSIQIDGQLSSDTLREALKNVVEKYEILRTAFRDVPAVSFPLQVISDDVMVSWYQQSDLSNLTADRQALRIIDLAQAMNALDFDWAHGPLFRFSLVTLEPCKHLLLITLPALCADAATLNNLVREIGLSYEELDRAGDRPEVTGETLQYADFAEWQNTLLTASETETGRQYWQQQKLPNPFTTLLPFEESSEVSAFAPEVLSTPLSPTLSVAIDALARSYDVSVPAFLLTCWQVLLGYYRADSPLLLGVGLEGRRYTELQDAFGLFTHTLPFFSPLEEDMTFSHLLQATNEQLANMQEQQEYFSWEQMETGLPLAVPTPYFPLAFEFEQRNATYHLANLSFALTGLSTYHDMFHLKLLGSRNAQGFLLEWHYDSSRFSNEAIACLAGQFSTLLEHALQDPVSPLKALSILSDAERQQVLYTFNETQVNFPHQVSILDTFSAQVLQSPDAIAVVFEDQYLTYAELQRQAHSLACFLREIGVRPEVRVGLCLERSAELIICLLGVLMAGGAYVPLDPDYPVERLHFMLKDAEAKVLLTHERLQTQFANTAISLVCVEQRPWLQSTNRKTSEHFVREISGENAAYVIYTSGTTGRPKGVMIPHSALANHMAWMQMAFPLEATDRVLQKTSFSFDASIWEFYAPLLAGAQLVMAFPRIQQDSSALIEALLRHEITIFQAVPSLLQLLLLDEQGLKRCRSLRRVFCGGEKLTTSLKNQFFSCSDARLYNLYGPTESCIEVTSWEGSPENQQQKICIGRPIANTQVYILDTNQQPVAVGVAGELYVGGAGLARGYLNQPEITAEKFLPDPFGQQAGGRLYRTGDIGRFLPDGTIEYLARQDNQVKFRGFRIEPGEIETVLEQHPAVEKGVVLVRTSASEEQSLIAYLKLNQERAFTLQKLLSLQARGSLLPEQCHVLPDGTLVASLNTSGTDYLYKEIFQDRAYLKHGITLHEDDCIFDVGANIGMFTIFASRMCGRAKIYAFEPIPPTCNVLRLNAALYNEDVRVFECGISDTTREAIFTFYPNVALMSSQYADPAGERELIQSFLTNQEQIVMEEADLYQEMIEERLQTEQITCQMRTISDIIREYDIKRIDLLKVDVEKSEMEVLAGITESDWPKIQQLVMEVHDIGDRLEQVKACLTEHGYSVTFEQEASLRGTTLYNLFAIHQSAHWATEEKRQFLPIPWPNPSALIEDVQGYMSAKLPRHMLPSRYVLVDTWPLTLNGKIDFRALPEPEQTSAESDLSYRAPRTSIETTLTEIWAEVLKVKRVGITTNFFNAGGHSLLVTQVISRIQQAFGVKLPIRSLFEKPTIAEFSRQIEQALQEKREEANPPIQPSLSRENLPLSFAQESLWFLHKLEPASPFYNMPFAMHLQGPLHVQALNQSLTGLVQRHEVLRTTFTMLAGRPVQVLAPSSSASVGGLIVADLSALNEAERIFHTRQLVSDEALQTFDLEKGPLLRSTLLRLRDDEHVLLLTLHHSIFDGQSMDIFMQELSIFYRSYLTGQSPSLPPLALQYADYASWQRQWFQGETADRQVAYWKQQLQDAPPLLEIPTDHPRPSIQTFRGAGEAFNLSRPTTDALKALSEREGVTLFMALLAVFTVLLYRYTGQDDILLSTPVSNRDRLDFERLIGFFVNMLVLRVDCSGNPSFQELLARVREVTLEGYSHQDLPFELLVQSLQPDRNLSYNPLFQVHLVLQNSPKKLPELEGLSLQPLNADKEIAKFDLTLYLEDGEDGLAGEWEYSTDLFEASTIRQLAGHFRTLLNNIVLNPAQSLDTIPLLTAEEEHLLLSAWQAQPALSAEEKCVHELFAEQARQTPDSIAVLDDAGQLTYAELDCRANKLARHLQTLGVGPEVRVAISMERSVELIIAILGVFKAGGSYMPIDPTYPQERRGFMEADAGVHLLITTRQLAQDNSTTKQVLLLDADWPVIAQYSSEELTESGSPDNLAYVIYTSGSTGKPKGVMVSHRGLANLSYEQRRAFLVKPSSRVLQFASPSFDASVSELVMALLEGAALCLFSRESLLPGSGLLRLLQKYAITHVTFPPSVLAVLPVADLPTLQTLIVAGEASSPEILGRWSGQCEIFNAYGPTEATVCATIAHVSGHLPPGIGGPIANTQVYVLDHLLQPVPVGVPGELYIGGLGLARGYFQRPDLTAERFIPHPFSQLPGSRLYRTGDKVRYRGEGDLEFLGRIDQQVKIRGFRIEPGEIEQTLQQYPAVQHAVVLAQEDTTGSKQLVAYLVVEAPSITDQLRQELRHFLEKHLPDYLIPSAFVLLERFPVTPSGKVDRQALIAEWSKRAQVDEFIAPRTATEEIIADIWAELLMIEKVGIHDNFFTLGGHSLIATQLNARVSEKLLIELPLHTIFAAPTVARFADVVEQALTEQIDSQSLRRILDTLH